MHLTRFKHFLRQHWPLANPLTDTAMSTPGSGRMEVYVKTAVIGSNSACIAQAATSRVAGAASTTARRRFFCPTLAGFLIKRHQQLRSSSLKYGFLLVGDRKDFQGDGSVFELR